VINRERVLGKNLDRSATISSCPFIIESKKKPIISPDLEKGGAL